MKNFILIFVVSLFLTSCTEKVDFDLNTEKSRLVVEGEIADANVKHWVKLTKTTSYFNDESAPVVSGAAVSLSDGDTSWVMTEERPGYYYTPAFEPELEKTYNLTIESEGETYEGSDYLSFRVEADSITLELDTEYDFEEEEDRDFYSIVMFAQEPAGLGDSYIWKYWIKKPDTAWKNMTPQFLDWSYSDDEFIDGNYPKEGWQIFGYIPKEDFPKGTVVRVEMYHISPVHYDFLIAMGEQTDRNGFFDGPPANIPSNMSNGALGFFSAVTVDTVWATVTQ